MTPVQLDPRSPAVAGADAVDTAVATIVAIVIAFFAEAELAPPDEIGPTSSLLDFALNSVQLLQVHARLEDTFGVELSVSALFDHDTIGALAAYLTAIR